MNPSRTPSERDAIALFADLRRDLERRFEALSAAPLGRRASFASELVLALELRWKLEEELLFPALRRAGCGDFLQIQADAEDLAKLRELGEMVLAGAPSPARQGALLAVLEGGVRLHLEQVDELLHQLWKHPGPDWPAMGREMQALLQRWRREIAETGDIEDEERDPVGLPPR